MLAVEQRLKTLARVADKLPIEVSELAHSLGASEMTIRRDIHRLERDGFVRRTHGGATAHLVRSLDVGPNARVLEHTREE
jgi:DeoR/GlpR family transcriptional regulator of sugar metabolism